MIKTSRIQRFICQFVCAVFIMGQLQGVAMAGMITTQDMHTNSQMQQQKQDIKQLITRDEVKNYLLDNGVSAEDVMQRVEHLDTQELAALHQQLDDLPAGQGALETVLLVFIILILLDLTGVTDVFPRI